MLSLAKLSALAADSDMTVQVTEINSELSLIEYQEQLPENLLAAFGYETQQQKVLKAEEIINVCYMKCHNKFKKNLQYLFKIIYLFF